MRKEKKEQIFSKRPIPISSLNASQGASKELRKGSGKGIEIKQGSPKRKKGLEITKYVINISVSLFFVVETEF